MKNIHAIWKIYMHNYDAVLTRFPSYALLHKSVMDMVRDILNKQPEKNVRIIDLGCGTGNMTARLVSLQDEYKTRKISIIGMDNNDEALQLAAQKTNERAEFRKFELGSDEIAKHENITGWNDEISIVILINVFFSLTEEQKRNVPVAIRKLTGNNGMVIISEPHNPIPLKKVIKDAVTDAGGISKFIQAILPIFSKLMTVLFINARYLARLVYPAELQHRIFKEYGFKLKNSVKNAYAGSNSIDVYLVPVNENTKPIHSNKKETVSG